MVRPEVFYYSVLILHTISFYFNYLFPDVISYVFKTKIVMNLISETAQKITKNRTFNVFIFILILFSAIIIGTETYSGIASEHKLILVFLDKLIISIFALEIGLKNFSHGGKPWNFFQTPGI